MITKEGPDMDMKLELVPIPVADVDRAKAFYTDKLGFVDDVDVRPTEGMRFVQLTPPASACSILLSIGMREISEMTPGAAKGMHLVVPDLETAREELAQRGVEVTEIEEVGPGVRYVYLTDPDGNFWMVQEMAWRTRDKY